MKRNHRKSVWMKGVSAVLAVALVFGQTGIISFAKTETDTVKTSKEETVYVISGADGAVQKLIVSDWLKNTGKETTLSDLSELTDIKNVKGEESFTQNEKNNVDWEAKGKDIYYQGTLEKDVPVEQKISYQLDGKDISPEMLAGKSGKVQVCFDYTNHQKEKVMVNGKEEELYVPFVVLTAMVLDNENFSNVEVSSGKIIDDGERTVVVGYAMPGLEDNLKLESMGLEKLDLPQKVEVSFDAVDFELAGTMTIVTSEIFNDLDMDVDEKQQTLSEDMKDLQEAMQALMDGTSELYDGVLKLADGTEELNDGISNLDQGAGDLKDGAGKLYQGAGSLNDGVSTLKTGAGALISGMQQLNSGLATLENNSTALKGGLSDIQQGILDSLNTKIEEANRLLVPYGVQVSPVSLASYGKNIEENINALQGVIGTLDRKMDQVEGQLRTMIASLNTQQPENQAQVISEPEESTENQAVTEEVSPQQENNVQEEGSSVPQGSVSQEPSTPPENDEQLEAEETIEPMVQEREVFIVQASAVTVNDPIDQLLTLQTAKTNLEALKETMKSMKKLLDGTTQLSGGINSYTAGVTSAYQGAGALLSNAPKLTSGIDTLKDGTGQLLNGAGDLYDGTKKLKDGTVSLKDGGNELKKGVADLQAGALKLKDGTVEFNDQGIKKLVELLDEDLPELTGRLEGTLDAAMAYKSFSGISEQMDGSVKFIYKTDAIKSE